MTNGNSQKIASEIIDAILAYGDARADKDLVKGTASLKKSIELIRSTLSVCADVGKGEAVARVNNEGFIIETGALPLMPGMQLYTAPQAECAPRIETSSEHIARDIREGRFPQRSEPQRVATESGVVHPNKEFKDGYQEGHFYGYHEGMKAAEAAGASNERADAEKDAALEKIVHTYFHNNCGENLFNRMTEARAILAANKGD